MLQSKFRVKGENERSGHLGETKVALDAEMESTGGVRTMGSIRLTAKGLLHLKEVVPQGCRHWRCNSWCCSFPMLQNPCEVEPPWGCVNDWRSSAGRVVLGALYLSQIGTS